MTDFFIKKTKNLSGNIILSSSKSESNRTLIIQSLCNEKFNITNLSDAKDTLVLKGLLDSQNYVLDVGPAGTAMRFLTAYLSVLENSSVTLTGSERMLERPIGALTEALKRLGADIEYLQKDGYPPLRIKGKILEGGEVSIPANISSQFITALLLIAPKLSKGLTLNLEGKVISKSYIKMTLKLMEYFGVKSEWKGNAIHIPNQAYKARDIHIEPDWSAASYWYSFAAFSPQTEIHIKDLRKESLQGDSAISEIMKSFGVETVFSDDGIKIIKKPNQSVNDYFEYDFTDCPDLAQTITVICAGLNISSKLTGLESLKIKETDRINALVTELSKVGADIKGTENSISIETVKSIGKVLETETYKDHRMAMAFAPLALITDKLIIKDTEVVDKSYPGFWSDMKKTGFELKEV